MSVTIFVCSRERPPCYRCALRAVKRCDHPGCERLLCDEHARGTKCSRHAPSVASASMPARPPSRASADDDG